MIEEFIQSLRQAEAEAKDVIKAAREKVQVIQRDSETRLATEKASAQLSLQQCLDALDEEANQQVRLAEDQLQRDLKEQIQSVEHIAREHKDAALNFLLTELISR